MSIAMLSNTNLSKEAATLTKWLVSIPSVAHAKGPALICQAIHDGLVEFPYFKKHKDKLNLIEHQDSAKSSVIALVKAMEEVEETIVLLCDTDTTSPYHYGMLKGFSTNCDELRNRLLDIEDLSSDQNFKAGLNQDNFLFGLGVLQSKCATGSMLVALKELSDNYVRLNVNILFICTSESAIQHRGIKKCIPFIQELIDQEHLKLRLAINAKPNFPLHRHDQDLHIFTGNYGKVEPSFYIIGNSTASFKPYSGFSASIIASELIRELELNAKLTQKINHAPLVPTFDSLRVKEFGKEYSPDGMQISFSLPIVNLDLADLLEILKEAAAKAIEHAADLVDQREALFAHLNQEDFNPQLQDAEVVSFSDLLERASHNFTGNLQKALAGMVQKCRSEGLSLHQASITIIERLNELAKLPRPSVVVYFTDNFLPPQGLSASLSQDREIFMILDDLLNRFSKDNTHSPSMATYYAPTDACLMRPINLYSSIKTLRKECPVGVEDLDGLNVPTITLGVKGDNLTLLTEYVDKSMFEYLPSLVVSIVDALGDNPVGSYHSTKLDLDSSLESLAKKAESIASATITEARTITKEQKEGESFYTQLSQGTLEPQTLDTFLKQQQDYNKQHPSSQPGSKLKGQAPTAALESPEKFSAHDHDLGTTDPLASQDEKQPENAKTTHTLNKEPAPEQAPAAPQTKETGANAIPDTKQAATAPSDTKPSELQAHEPQSAVAETKDNAAPDTKDPEPAEQDSKRLESAPAMESHIDLVIDAAHLEEDEAEHAEQAEKEQEQANDIQNAIAQSINENAELNSELTKASDSAFLQPTKVEVALVPEDEGADEASEQNSSKLGKLKKLFKLDSENTSKGQDSKIEPTWSENNEPAPTQDTEHQLDLDVAKQDVKTELASEHTLDKEPELPVLSPKPQTQKPEEANAASRPAHEQAILESSEEQSAANQPVEDTTPAIKPVDPAKQEQQAKSDTLSDSKALDESARSLDNLDSATEASAHEMAVESKDDKSQDILSSKLQAQSTESDLKDQAPKDERASASAQSASAPTDSKDLEVAATQDKSQSEAKADAQAAGQALASESKAKESTETKSSPFAMVSSFFKQFKLGKHHDKADHKEAMKSPLGIEDDVDWLNTPELTDKDSKLDTSTPVESASSALSLKLFIPVMPKVSVLAASVAPAITNELAGHEQSLEESLASPVNELEIQLDSTENSVKAPSTSSPDRQEADKVLEDESLEDKSLDEANKDLNVYDDEALKTSESDAIVESHEVSSEQVVDLLLSSIKDKFKSNSLASIDNPSDYQHHDLPLNNNVYANDINLDEVPVKNINGAYEGIHIEKQAPAHQTVSESNAKAIEAEIVELEDDTNSYEQESNESAVSEITEAESTLHDAAFPEESFEEDEGATYATDHNFVDANSNLYTQALAAQVDEPMAATAPELDNASSIAATQELDPKASWDKDESKIESEPALQAEPAVEDKALLPDEPVESKKSTLATTADSLDTPNDNAESQAEKHAATDEPVTKAAPAKQADTQSAAVLTDPQDAVTSNSDSSSLNSQDSEAQDKNAQQESKAKRKSSALERLLAIKKRIAKTSQSLADSSESTTDTKEQEQSASESLEQESITKAKPVLKDAASLEQEDITPATEDEAQDKTDTASESLEDIGSVSEEQAKSQDEQSTEAEATAKPVEASEETTAAADSQVEQANTTDTQDELVSESSTKEPDTKESLQEQEEIAESEPEATDKEDTYAEEESSVKDDSVVEQESVENSETEDNEATPANEDKADTAIESLETSKDLESVAEEQAKSQDEQSADTEATAEPAEAPAVASDSQTKQANTDTKDKLVSESATKEPDTKESLQEEVAEAEPESTAKEETSVEEESSVKDDSVVEQESVESSESDDKEATLATEDKADTAIESLEASEVIESVAEEQAKSQDEQSTDTEATAKPAEAPAVASDSQAEQADTTDTQDELVSESSTKEPDTKESLQEEVAESEPEATDKEETAVESKDSAAQERLLAIQQRIAKSSKNLAASSDNKPDSKDEDKSSVSESSGASEKKLSRLEELSLRLAAMHTGESTDSIKDKLAQQQQQAQEDKSFKPLGSSSFGAKVTLPSDIDLTKAIDSNVTMLSKKSLFVSEDPHNTRDIEEVFAEAEAEAAAKRAEVQRRLKSLNEAIAKQEHSESAPNADTKRNTEPKTANAPTSESEPLVKSKSDASPVSEETTEVLSVNSESRADSQDAPSSKQDTDAIALQAQDDASVAKEEASEVEAKPVVPPKPDLASLNQLIEEAKAQAALAKQAQSQDQDDSLATDTNRGGRSNEIDELKQYPEVGVSTELSSKLSPEMQADNAKLTRSASQASPKSRPAAVVDKSNADLAAAQDRLAAHKNENFFENMAAQARGEESKSTIRSNQAPQSKASVTPLESASTDPNAAPLDEATRREMSALRKINPEEAIAELLYADEDFSEASDEPSAGENDSLAARRAALRRAMYGDDSGGSSVKPGSANLDPNALGPTHVMGKASSLPKKPPKNDIIKHKSTDPMEAVSTSNPGVRILRTPNANLRKAQREHNAEPTSATAIIGQKDRVVPEKKEGPAYSTAIIGQKERVVPEKGQSPEYSTAIIGQKERVVPEKGQGPEYSTAIIGQDEHVVAEHSEGPEYSTAIIGQKERVVPEKGEGPEYSTAIIGQKERVVPEKGEGPEYSTAIIGQKERVVPEKGQGPEYSTAIIGQKERVVPEKGEGPEYSTAIIGQKERVVPEKGQGPEYSTAIIGQKERVVPEKGEGPEYSTAIIGQKERVVPEKGEGPAYSTAIIGQNKRMVPEHKEAPAYSTAIIGKKERAYHESAK